MNQENLNVNDTGFLNCLLDGIKSIPRVTAATAVLVSSLVPGSIGITNLAVTVIPTRLFYGDSAPTIMDYGIAAGLAALGVYATFKLRGPAIRGFLKIYYSDLPQHLRPSEEEMRHHDEQAKPPKI